MDGCARCCWERSERHRLRRMARRLQTGLTVNHRQQTGLTVNHRQQTGLTVRRRQQTGLTGRWTAALVAGKIVTAVSRGLSIVKVISMLGHDASCSQPAPSRAGFRRVLLLSLLLTACSLLSGRPEFVHCQAQE